MYTLNNNAGSYNSYNPYPKVSEFPVAEACQTQSFYAPSAPPIASAIPLYSQPEETDRVPQTVRANVLKLLDKLECKATEILAPKAQAPASSANQRSPIINNPTHINLDFADRHTNIGFLNLGTTREVHHHHYRSESQAEIAANKEKNETTTRIVVGLLGVTAAGVAAYFLGKTMEQSHDAAEVELSYADLKQYWNQHKVDYPANYCFNVDCAIERGDRIFARERTSRIHKIALITLSLVAAGLAVGGAVVASRRFMLAAAVVSALVIVGGCFKWGGDATRHNRDRKDALEIQVSLKFIKSKYSLPPS